MKKYIILLSLIAFSFSCSDKKESVFQSETIKGRYEIVNWKKIVYDTPNESFSDSVNSDFEHFLIKALKFIIAMQSDVHVKFSKNQIDTYFKPGWVMYKLGSYDDSELDTLGFYHANDPIKYKCIKNSIYIHDKSISINIQNIQHKELGKYIIDDKYIRIGNVKKTGDYYDFFTIEFVDYPDIPVIKGSSSDMFEVKRLILRKLK